MTKKLALHRWKRYHTVGEMKSAVVSIIGRPSSGKSTLLNHLCGYKVSIVAGPPQTTRNKVRGIVTREEGQLVFIDTPGFHASEKKMNIYMKELVFSSLEDIDLLLYVIDSTRTPAEEEAALFEVAKNYTDMLVVAVNKIDVVENCADLIEETVRDRLGDVETVRVSGKGGTGTSELLEVLFRLAPEGEQMYPDDFYTDQEPTFRASEIIREKAINQVRQELPHSLYVEIADMEADEESGKLWIRAFIIVERESQKGIVVGKGGAIIRDIRKEAQQELGSIFPYRIHLDLRVKVQPKWRKNDTVLHKLIQ